VSGSAVLADALDALLRFGALMLRSGESAFRVRDDMHRLAPRLGAAEVMLPHQRHRLAVVRRGLQLVVVEHRRDERGVVVHAQRVGLVPVLAEQEHIHVTVVVEAPVRSAISRYGSPCSSSRATSQRCAIASSSDSVHRSRKKLSVSLGPSSDWIASKSAFISLVRHGCRVLSLMVLC